MGFLNVLNFHLGLQMDASDSLRETDDGLELTHGDGDTRALLGDLLVLIVHSVLHVHVLEHVARLLRQTREELHLCIG